MTIRCNGCGLPIDIEKDPLCQRRDAALNFCMQCWNDSKQEQYALSRKKWREDHAVHDFRRTENAEG